MSTFVLVHGSAQGAAGWDLLVRELQALGQRAICVELPADCPDASATDYAELIGSTIAQARRPIVVAHSVSGLFLPLVPGHADVERLVYLAAVLPFPGQSFRAQIQNDPGAYRPDFLQVKPPLDEAIARQYLFHDASGELLGWALSTLRMMYARQAIAEETPLREWPSVPSTYISCSGDRTINPEWWEKAACERLRVEPVRMEGGHAPFVARARELAERLVKLRDQGSATTPP